MIDPQTGADIPARTQDQDRPPRYDSVTESSATSWIIPMALVVMVVVAIAYYFNTSTSVPPGPRADGGAVTATEPSPN
jgi:hypothetical protein